MESGRRVEALRECARLRHVLGEVGVQPSDDLIAREREILGVGLRDDRS